MTPEERRKIYEEEKARIESGGEDRTKDMSSTGLEPNVAGLLCYLGWWVSGIIFIVLEQKNRLVRFHAVQSMVLFGAAHLALGLVSRIPVVGWLFGTVIGVGAFILWILLMARTYRGETIRIPVAAELAERLVGAIPGSASDAGTSGQPIHGQDGAPAKTDVQVGRYDPGTVRRGEKGRGGRIASSAVAIAWGVALLVFFNFFEGYIAYYHVVKSNGISTWVRESLLTGDYALWLPIVNAVLVISIACHIVLLAIDRYVLREATLVVIDLLTVVCLAALLALFPFDFCAVPSSGVATGLQIGVRVTLGLIMFGIAVGVLVRLIKLVVNLVRGKATY